MNESKCPHCGVRLGNLFSADACPSCGVELGHKAKRLILAPANGPPKEDACAIWLSKQMLRFVGLSGPYRP